ncbi:hypothetical protein AHAS_Ahas10G0128100 [Arachis hypogaea]
MMEMSVDGEENRLKFKRVFILNIQMSFLLSTTLRKQLKEKKKEKRKEEKKEKKKKTISAESESVAESESDSEDDLEETPKRRKQPKRMTKKMESKKRKHVTEDSSSKKESESDDEFKEQEESLNEPVPIQEGIIDDNPKGQMIVLRIQTYSQSEPLDIHPPAKVVTDGIILVANAALKNDSSVPSFSFGFSQSSEEATLQEGELPADKRKSQDSLILVEELEELVEVMNTGVATALNYAKQKSPSP